MYRKLLTIMVVVTALQVEAEPLQIFTVDEPPSSYVDQNGELKGFAVDVVKAIQAELNDQTPIRVMPEIRVLKTASETPNVLLFGFSKTPERAEKYHMITLLLRKPWVLYAKSKFEGELTTIDDAKAVGTIGVVRGDVRSIYLDELGFNNTQKVAYHELNVRMLMNERVDLIFYEPLGLAYAADNMGIARESFKPVLRPKSSEVYLMMSKAGTDINLVQRWQKAASKLKDSGRFKIIADEWSQIIEAQTGVKSATSQDALDF